jgi:hypothetical protein
MCDPFTTVATGALALADTVGNTAMNYGKAEYNGAVQQQRQHYQAHLASERANQTLQESQLKAANQRKAATKALGQQRVRQAAAGGTLTGASNMALATEKAADLELEALVTEWQGRNDARRYRQQAALSRFDGRVARDKSKMQANQVLLNGGLDLAGQALSFAGPTGPKGGIF